MKIYTYDNKIMTVGGKWMEQPAQPAPVLHPYTIRLRFRDGTTPTFRSPGTYVQVSSSPNIWDLTYENTDWGSLCSNESDLIEVIGANTTGVTRMNQMFYGCTSLTSVPSFNTSIVTNISAMFHGCRSLTIIPLFDTSSVHAMNYMFYNCQNVQSGALALYQQASSQSTIPEHLKTFRDCGIATTTGRAELAQIPDDWK